MKNLFCTVDLFTIANLDHKKRANLTLHTGLKKQECQKMQIYFLYCLFAFANCPFLTSFNTSTHEAEMHRVTSWLRCKSGYVHCALLFHVKTAFSVFLSKVKKSFLEGEQIKLSRSNIWDATKLSKEVMQLFFVLVIKCSCQNAWHFPDWNQETKDILMSSLNPFGLCRFWKKKMSLNFQHPVLKKSPG